MQSFNAAPCQAQCQKELAGTGYLQQHVAQYFFERLASQPPDPECKLDSARGYGFDFYDGTDLSYTPDLMTLEQCVYAKGEGCGTPGPLEVLRSECFTLYYRFNDQIRSDVEACFGTGTCYELGKCIAATPFEWQTEPWLAGGS